MKLARRFTKSDKQKEKLVDISGIVDKLHLKPLAAHVVFTSWPFQRIHAYRPSKSTDIKASFRLILPRRFCLVAPPHLCINIHNAMVLSCKTT